MKKYIIREREAGNVIDSFNDYREAQAALASYEIQDKTDGTYTEDFYELVERPQYTLHYNGKTFRIEQGDNGRLIITLNGEPFKDAGALIANLGGITNVLCLCDESDCTAEEKAVIMESIRKKSRLAQAKASVRREIEDKERIEAQFNVFINGNREKTIENIHIMLAYLNTRNWGSWELPLTKWGYTCNQYDCDGKQATTMILDEPIMINGEAVTHLVYGAPRGHLTKYMRV